MKNIITITTLSFATVALANAEVVNWDEATKSYSFESSSWSKSDADTYYNLTLGGVGFDLSLKNWEIELNLNVKAETGANDWGTAAFATGSDPVATSYSEGFQAYIKVGGGIEVKGGGFEKTDNSGTYGTGLATVDKTTSLPLTFKIVRSGDTATYSVYSGSTLLGESEKAFDWTGTVTTLTTSITDAQLSDGWTLASGRFSVVPEPSAFGLLAGLGALALAGTRRRRRKA